MSTNRTEIRESFLRLVRLGIGNVDVNSGIDVNSSEDWVVLKALADAQGLSAIILDALNKDGMNIANIIPVQMKLEWIGEVMQNIETRYEQYEKAIGSLAGWYNQHGFKMMVLKGYACSLDWPKPEHRPCGDIDIWLFGNQKESDALLVKGKSIKVDTSHHHHTVFEWGGFAVENHYDFVNVHAHRSNAEIEKIFKKLSEDDSHSVEVMGEKIYLPSPNLHALFLIRHMVSHFAASQISLRHVLDWAFFVEKHTNDVDWKCLLSLLEKYHMKDFFNLINAICVDDLGFPVNLFPTVQFVSDLKERVLDDILNPEYTKVDPQRFLPRVVYKYKRWQRNAWKQRLCYKESRWEMFWTGIWAKILKPASI